MSFLDLFRKRNGKKKLAELKAQSENEYYKSVQNNKSFSNLHLRLRQAYRAKANIEKTFIEAARAYEIYETYCIEAELLNNEPMKEITPPKLENSFKILQSDNGYVVSYIPYEYAKNIFDIGISYQKSKITSHQARNRVELVFNSICKELNINKDIDILEFLEDMSENDN